MESPMVQGSLTSPTLAPRVETVEIWDEIILMLEPPHQYPFHPTGAPSTAALSPDVLNLCLTNWWFYKLSVKYVYRRCTLRLTKHLIGEDWSRMNYDLKYLRAPTLALEQCLPLAVRLTLFQRLEEGLVHAYEEWERNALTFGKHVRMAYWNWDEFPAHLGLKKWSVEPYKIEQFQRQDITQEDKQLLQECTDEMNSRRTAVYARLFQGFGHFTNLRWLSIEIPFCGLPELRFPLLTALCLRTAREWLWKKMDAGDGERVLSFLSKHESVQRCRLDHGVLDHAIELAGKGLRPVLPNLSLLVSGAISHAACDGGAECVLSSLDWVSPNAPIRKARGIFKRHLVPEFVMSFSEGTPVNPVPMVNIAFNPILDLHSLAFYGERRHMHQWGERLYYPPYRYSSSLALGASLAWDGSDDDEIS